jgi:beta-galactosidase GanA
MYAGAEIHRTTNGAMITRRSDGNREFVIAASVNGKASEYRFEGTRVDLLTGKSYDGSVQIAPYEIFVLE